MYKRSKRHRKQSEWYFGSSPRTRTKRKKIKRSTKERRARNKRLISLYPFLKPYGWDDWNDEVKKNNRYQYISLWDEVPNGWTKNFGRIFCDEIKKTLENIGYTGEITFEQCKEKYGGLRVYATAPHEVQEIISIYGRIAENICCGCGKPHVPMLNLSWISPCCKDCYTEIQKRGYYKKPYEDYAPDDKSQWMIPQTLSWKKYSTEGNKIIEIDISDRVKKIEERWEEILKKKEKDRQRKERRS